MHEYIGISVRDQNMTQEDKDQIFTQVKEIFLKPMTEYNEKSETPIEIYDFEKNLNDIKQGEECRYVHA